MHLQTNVVFGLALAALAPATVAQEEEFTGVIQPATLPSICQEETHFSPVPGRSRSRRPVCCSRAARSTWTSLSART